MSLDVTLPFRIRVTRKVASETEVFRTRSSTRLGWVAIVSSMEEVPKQVHDHARAEIRLVQHVRSRRAERAGPTTGQKT
jgi:hypothetical protein